MLLQLTCSCNFQLSACVFILFYLQHHHADMFILDSQEVCDDSISFVVPSWLTGFCHFNSQFVRNPILFTPSLLTCTTHFQLSGSLYFHFMRSTIKTDLFFWPFWLRQWVISFSSWYHHSWCAIFNSQPVRNFISWAASSWLTCFLPLSIIRKCVFLFYEQHQCWHVPTCWLSDCVYFWFMSSTVIADIFSLLWLLVGV